MSSTAVPLEMTNVETFNNGRPVADNVQADFYFEVVQNLPAAVYTCDQNGLIMSFNKAAILLWGREPEIGKDLWCGSWKILKPDGSNLPLDQCPMAITLREKRPVFNEEILIERPNGERRHILPHPKPLFDDTGTMIGAVNMLVDITESKRMRALNEKLRDYNEQLEQFAFAASHDLQEPLRKISTFVSILLEREQESHDGFNRKYLDKIWSSSQRMTSLILDLLAYTRDTHRNAGPSPVDLNQVVTQVQTDLELLITEKNAVFEIDHLPEIHADEAQANRLFYNLINNALKFSTDSRKPYVEVRYVYEGGEFFELIVKDNGIGFDQSFAEKIFNIFQRLNNKESFPGNGIGLALCKKIVENHDGSIRAASEKGKGATFTCRLPSRLLVSR